MDQVPANVLGQLGILEEGIEGRQEIGRESGFKDGQVCNVVRGGRQTGRDGVDCVLGGHASVPWWSLEIVVMLVVFVDGGCGWIIVNRES